MNRAVNAPQWVWVRTLAVISAIILAPLFGIGVAAALRGQVLLLGALGALTATVFMWIMPIEMLLLLGILGGMLTDSRLIDSDLLYYARFVPLGLLTVRTCLDAVLKRETGIRAEPVILVPGLVFVALAFFSAVYSLYPPLTFQRALSMLLVIICFGLGLPNYLADYASLRRALVAVTLLISGFVLLGSVLGTVEGGSATLDQSFVRVRGFFGNPNTQGLMAMLIFFPFLWWRQMTQNPMARLPLTIALAALGLLVILSGSRASLVGLLAGGIALIYMYGRRASGYAALMLAGVIVLIGVALFIPEFGRVVNFQTGTGEVVGGVRQVDRPYLIQRAIQLGMESPIYGVGFGASDVVFEQDRRYLISQSIYVAGAHNSYTRLFVDLGIVGVLLGLTTFGLVLWRALRAPFAIRTDPTIAIMTATIVTGLTGAFFEGWLFGFGSASTVPFWFFLALIPIRLRQLQTEQTTPVTNELTVAEAVA